MIKNLDETDKKKCHFWNHEWTQWKDVCALDKRNVYYKNVTNSGIKQERRCQYCNKVQLRVEWMNK